MGIYVAGQQYTGIHIALAQQRKLLIDGDEYFSSSGESGTYEFVIDTGTIAQSSLVSTIGYSSLIGTHQGAIRPGSFTHGSRTFTIEQWYSRRLQNGTQQIFVDVGAAADSAAFVALNPSINNGLGQTITGWNDEGDGLVSATTRGLYVAGHSYAVSITIPPSRTGLTISLSAARVNSQITGFWRGFSGSVDVTHITISGTRYRIEGLFVQSGVWTLRMSSAAAINEMVRLGVTVDTGIPGISEITPGRGSVGDRFAANVSSGYVVGQNYTVILYNLS